MKIKILFSLFLALSLVLLSPIFNFAKADTQDKLFPARLFFFHSKSCPHCREEEKYLESLKNKYPSLEIYGFEVSSNFKNNNLFKKIGEHYGLQGSVPVTIIKNDPIVGFDSETGAIAKEIENQIEYCLENACNPYPVEMLNLEKISTAEEQPVPLPEKKEKDVEIFGKNFRLNENHSLFLLGAFLGLADGINPCMFSVLLFLLTYLMAIGSTKKALKAGIAFVITTFVVYFIFMFGIIRIIDIFQITVQARTIIAILALLAGFLMIKDFFFYGKWFSLEIPSGFKPKLELLIKKGTIPSVVLLAILAGLVELPCTSGLPLAYVSILANQNASTIFYLLIYNIFFVLPLILIVLGVSLAWSKVENIESWREKTKKYMRLIAGVILIFLAVALWQNWL